MQWSTVSPLSWRRMPVNAGYAILLLLALLTPATTSSLQQQPEQTPLSQLADYARVHANAEFKSKGDDLIRDDPPDRYDPVELASIRQRLMTPVRTTAIYSKLYQWALQEVSPFATLSKFKRTSGRGVLGLDNIDFAASMLDRARGRGSDLLSSPEMGTPLRGSNYRGGRMGSLPGGRASSLAGSRPVPIDADHADDMQSSPGTQRRLQMNISVGDLQKLISMIKHGR